MEAERLGNDELVKLCQEQALATLQQHQRQGFFEFTPADALGPVLPAKGAPFNSHSFAPVSALLHASRVAILNSQPDVPPDLRAFIMERFEAFLQQSEAVLRSLQAPQAHREQARLRVDATKAVMLVTAGMLDDVGLVERICQDMGGVRRLKDWRLWLQGTTPELRSLGDAHHPAMVFARHDKPAALKQLIDLGFDPCEKVVRREKGREPLSSAAWAALPHPEFKFYIDPSAIDLMLPRWVEMLKKSYAPHSSSLQGMSEEILHWSNRALLGRNPTSRWSDEVAIALRHGVYELDPYGAFQVAVAGGESEVAERLAGLQDWGKAKPENSPVRTLLSAKMDCEKHDALVLDVFRRAIAQGRADLLTAPMSLVFRDDPDAIDSPKKDSRVMPPLAWCAEKGLVQAVLACMEEGTDPLQPCDGDRCARDLAAQENHEDVLRVMDSFLARKLAQATLREIGRLSP